MPLKLSPSDVSELKSFPDSTLKTIENADKGYHKGKISKDGSLCWSFKGSVVEVVNCRTGCRQAAFSIAPTMEEVEVVDVVEYWSDECCRLAVIANTSSPRGLVLLLNIHSSKVVHTIQLPYRVSSVEVVTTAEGNNMPSWAFSEPFTFFHGILAVGTVTGRVYLLDLCLDEYSWRCDEQEPASVSLLSDCRDRFPSLRSQIISRGSHPAWLLNEDSHVREEYLYLKPGDQDTSFEADAVQVTCLRYIPQLGTLVVGFNFGGFQMWKLHNPSLEYSSRLDPDWWPVVKVAYQEPENDPKNFSYIWVARDQTFGKPEEDGLSKVSLYQLSYERKAWYSNYGTFYEGLLSVCFRLEHKLEVDGEGGNQTTALSRIVAAYTLEDPHYTPPPVLNPHNDSFDDTSPGPDLSLFLFAWEAQSALEGDKLGYYLAVFDINRWYHAQMPARVRHGRMDSCPFLAVYQLNDIADVAVPDIMQDVHVSGASVKRFPATQTLPPEQLFFPTALMFQGTCLMESGFVTANFLGIQRKVLRELAARGPDALLVPAESYHQCVSTGLISRTHDTHSLTAATMREALLQLLLHQGYVAVLLQCIARWADGEFVHQGCTLKFLLEWAWGQVVETKKLIDDTCEPLFDWSGHQVDSRMRQTLHRCLSSLFHLRDLFEAFLAHANSTATEEGTVQLETRLDVIGHLIQHLSVTQWCMTAGLLPECDEESGAGEGLYSYPVSVLVQAFSNRRAELQSLHSELTGQELLLVDGLVESTGGAVQGLWEQEGSNGLYPPPSLFAMLNVYLLESVPMATKHSLLLYLMLDLASLVPEDQHDEFSEKAAHFARAFSMPPALVRLVQGFWLLDHKNFEEGVEQLLQPAVLGEVGLGQARRVVKSLLFQGEQRLALAFLATARPPWNSPGDAKLQLTILLANGQVGEAFFYQRKFSDQDKSRELLQHLFLGCLQTKKMEVLLRLPLSPWEEEQLEEFFLASSSPHASELLLLHLLQRSHLAPAIRLHDKLRQKILTENSTRGRERVAAMTAIVDGFHNVLSKGQRHLLAEQPALSLRPSAQHLTLRRPEPLSTVVTQSANSKVKSRSTLFLALMNKVHEVVWDEPQSATKKRRSERDAGPFLSNPITPRRELYQSFSGTPPQVVYPRPKEAEPSSQRQSLLLSPTSTRRSLLLQGADASHRRSTFVGADALSLLQTPVVNRKTPSRAAPTPSSPTPQSILKVQSRLRMRGSPRSMALASPESRQRRSKRLGSPGTTPTPSPKKLKLDITSSSKHIRFAGLSSDEDTTPSVTPNEPTPSPTSPHKPPFPLLDNSPRARLRSRSPTPESLSPKFARHKESVSRSPPHSKSYPSPSKPPTVFSPPLSNTSDGEVTFNFQHQLDSVAVDDRAAETAVTSPAQQEEPVSMDVDAESRDGNKLADQESEEEGNPSMEQEQAGVTPRLLRSSVHSMQESVASSETQASMAFVGATIGATAVASADMDMAGDGELESRSRVKADGDRLDSAGEPDDSVSPRLKVSPRKPLHPAEGEPGLQESMLRSQEMELSPGHYLRSSFTRTETRSVTTSHQTSVETSTLSAEGKWLLSPGPRSLYTSHSEIQTEEKHVSVHGDVSNAEDEVPSVQAEREEGQNQTSDQAVIEEERPSEATEEPETALDENDEAERPDFEMQPAQEAVTEEEEEEEEEEEKDEEEQQEEESRSSRQLRATPSRRSRRAASMSPSSPPPTSSPAAAAEKMEEKATSTDEDSSPTRSLRATASHRAKLASMRLSGSSPESSPKKGSAGSPSPTKSAGSPSPRQTRSSPARETKPSKERKSPARSKNPAEVDEDATKEQADAGDESTDVEKVSEGDAKKEEKMKEESDATSPAKSPVRSRGRNLSSVSSQSPSVSPVGRRMVTRSQSSDSTPLPSPTGAATQLISDQLPSSPTAPTDLPAPASPSGSPASSPTRVTSAKKVSAASAAARAKHSKPSASDNTEEGPTPARSSARASRSRRKASASASPPASPTPSGKTASPASPPAPSPARATRSHKSASPPPALEKPATPSRRKARTASQTSPVRDAQQKESAVETEEVEQVSHVQTTRSSSRTLRSEDVEMKEKEEKTTPSRVRKSSRSVSREGDAKSSAKDKAPNNEVVSAVAEAESVSNAVSQKSKASARKSPSRQSRARKSVSPTVVPSTPSRTTRSRRSVSPGTVVDGTSPGRTRSRRSVSPGTVPPQSPSRTTRSRRSVSPGTVPSESPSRATRSRQSVSPGTVVSESPSRRTRSRRSVSPGKVPAESSPARGTRSRRSVSPGTVLPEPAQANGAAESSPDNEVFEMSPARSTRSRRSVSPGTVQAESPSRRSGRRTSSTANHRSPSPARSLIEQEVTVSRKRKASESRSPARSTRSKGTAAAVEDSDKAASPSRAALRKSPSRAQHSTSRGSSRSQSATLTTHQEEEEEELTEMDTAPAADAEAGGKASKSKPVSQRSSRAKSTRSQTTQTSKKKSEEEEVETEEGRTPAKRARRTTRESRDVATETEEAGKRSVKTKQKRGTPSRTKSSRSRSASTQHASTSPSRPAVETGPDQPESAFSFSPPLTRRQRNQLQIETYDLEELPEEGGEEEEGEEEKQEDTGRKAKKAKTSGPKKRAARRTLANDSPSDSPVKLLTPPSPQAGGMVTRKAKASKSITSRRSSAVVTRKTTRKRSVKLW